MGEKIVFLPALLERSGFHRDSMLEGSQDLAMGHPLALAALLARSKLDATIVESRFEPLLNRPDSRRTPLVDGVIHDPVQLTRDLFHDMLFGFRRLRQAGAVHEESRIEVVSEALKQPMDILPHCAQCCQNQAWQETFDHVGKISD